MTYLVSRRGWAIVGLLAIGGCAEGEEATANPFTTAAPMTMTMPAVTNPMTTMSATSAPDSDGPSGTSDGTSTSTPTTGMSDGTTEGSTSEATTTGVPPGCGDGMVDGDEECDDGNAVDTDACLNVCTIAKCGDGAVREGMEVCDDGNVDNTDACLVGCVAASCGDGEVYAGVEGCDDGNMVNDDDCTNMCALASCGDGAKQVGEVCDDGNMDNTDACTSMCQNSVCGDGFVHAGVEACDDMMASMTCDADCTAVVCGDGVVNAAAGEECDDGNMVETDACRNTCKAAKCLDGVVQAGVEECDDGNMVDNDMCSNLCKSTLCMPSGQRALFNALALDTASGCWSGNPCDNDQYSFDAGNGQNFQAFGQAISCSGAQTCVAHVGIGTYGSSPVCQGSWDVFCDGVMVGTIQTIGKTCTGSSMGNSCNITFQQRTCSTIELRAANDGDGTLSCCNGTQPDSMIVAVSAW